MTTFAGSWNEAGDRVRDIANGLPIHWGVRDAVSEPHVVVLTRGTQRRNGQGFDVNIYPSGDTYRAPVVCHTIVIR